MPDPPPPPVADDPDVPPGTRAAFGSIVAFWTFYCAVATLRAALLDFDGQADLLLRRLVVTAVSMAISWAMWRALRGVVRHGPGRAVGIVALLSVPAALAYAVVNQAIFMPTLPVHSPVRPPMRPPVRPPVRTVQVGDDAVRADRIGPVAIHADVAVNGYFFFVAWAALYLALAYAAQGRVAERRAARFAAAAQSAELRALRYQVNPHFLFNTLNSLSALVMTGRRDEAERMILNLSTFFRSSLAGDPATDVPLADEIALQRLYLAIETVRFPARMLLIEDIAAAVADALIPGLLLQPLVENAVKHGVARSRGLVTIAIRAWVQDGMLALSVTDDAPAGPDPGTDAPPPPATGIGLRNVADRLAARFGPHALCRAGPAPTGGFAVTILMPLVREG